jgi:hypothetical protein
MPISLASKIAIAFLRPYRSYLDGMNDMQNKRKEIEKSLQEKSDAIAEAAKKLNPKLSEQRLEYAKEGFMAINMHLFDSYNKCYGEVLPEIIELLTNDLERELKDSFSQDELKRIVEILKDESVQKLLSNKKLFSVLKQSEILLEHKMRIRTLENSSNLSGVDKISEILSDLRNKHHIDDNGRRRDEENEEENGEDFWRDNE